MKEYLFTKMKWLIFVAWNLINDVKIFFYSVSSRGVLNFELGTDVRPEVSTTTL